MKVSPEIFPKSKYKALWQKSIKRIILHIKIVRLIKNNANDKNHEYSDILIERSSIFTKPKTEIFLP